MFNLFIQIIAFLLAIFVLVTVHEYGHLWVAKRMGVKVLRFSIGFGRAIWHWQGKDGIEYAVGWLPLGGYVKLLDEREEKVPEDQLHLAFNRKPIWQRFLILIAGPLTNLFLGLIFFWVVFVIGIETIKPIIGEVTPNSIAANAGMKVNDQVIQVNGMKVYSWQKVLIALVYHLGNKGILPITVLQPNQQYKTYSLNINQWKVTGLNPDPLKALGIVPYEPPLPPVVAEIQKDSPAQMSGLAVGDKFIAIAGEHITSWQDVMNYVKAHPNEKVDVILQRANKLQTLSLNIGSKYISPSKKIGFLGVVPEKITVPQTLKYQPRYNLITAWLPAMNETLLFTQFNFVVLMKMITGHISIQGLGGPITIFTTAGAALKHGIVIYISFLAVISVMLATINVLPIPGLDGGHILFLIIEALRGGKPISLAHQILAWRLGLIFLVLVIAQATVNDLMRLIS